ncbi:MAG TPA: c-type cytochrome [Solirubrobacteraceae bacterium]|jgi:mono/diheme cytochrome c family protein
MRTRSAQPKIIALLVVVVAAAVGFTSCGTQGIQLAKSNPNYHGAELFLDHCSGCHTLAVVGAEGSASSIKDRLRTNGPNFNFRKEEPAQVLYAIRNGGFSGAIMPQNIVVGQAAREVAQFLAKYSGLQAKKVPTIENVSVEGSSTTATSPTATTGVTTPSVPAAGGSTKAAAGGSTKAAARGSTKAGAANEAGAATEAGTASKGGTAYSEAGASSKAGASTEGSTASAAGGATTASK